MAFHCGQKYEKQKSIQNRKCNHDDFQISTLENQNMHKVFQNSLKLHFNSKIHIGILTVLIRHLNLKFNSKQYFNSNVFVYSNSISAQCFNLKIFKEFELKWKQKWKQKWLKASAENSLQSSHEFPKCGKVKLTWRLDGFQT